MYHMLKKVVVDEQGNIYELKEKGSKSIVKKDQKVFNQNKPCKIIRITDDFTEYLKATLTICNSFLHNSRQDAFKALNRTWVSYFKHGIEDKTVKIEIPRWENYDGDSTKELLADVEAIIKQDPNVLENFSYRLETVINLYNRCKDEAGHKEVTDYIKSLLPIRVEKEKV